MSLGEQLPTFGTAVRDCSAGLQCGTAVRDCSAGLQCGTAVQDCSAGLLDPKDKGTALFYMTAISQQHSATNQRT